MSRLAKPARLSLAACASVAGFALVLAALGREPLRTLDALAGPTLPPLTLPMAWTWIAVTVLGSTICVGIVSATAALGLFGAGRQADAAFMLTAIVGAELLSESVKHILALPRPLFLAVDVGPLSSLASADPTTPGFPSGHALLSLVTYGYLTAVLAPGPLGFAGAVLLITLVGLSRVALGAHWPTDVLGGWLLGSAWLFLLLALRERLMGHSLREWPSVR